MPVALAAAVALWVVSLGAIDPAAMTDLGLISVLPASFFAALLVLTMSFAALVHRRPRRSLLLAAHLLALIAFLHATPTIVYGTLRYSWAWKHVGIVDYIQRHGSVATDIHALDVYHNWPGFFALDSLLTDLAGLDDTLALATWAPVFFNVLTLGAVLFVFCALTRDRRAIWLGGWLYLITCWVGQDYFSPQAFAFFLYLIVIGIVLKWLPRLTRSKTAEQQRPKQWARLSEWSSQDAMRAAMVALAVLLLAAIAASHALTAVMVTVALTVLVLFDICAVRSLPVVALALTVVWDFVFAINYVESRAATLSEKIRLPWVTTESSLTDIAQLSHGQVLVASVARALVVAVAVLALAGALRQWRSRGLNRPAVVLALAPLLLFLSGDYDGELLFRIYLFAVPFLAFLAGHALLASKARGRSWRAAIVSAAVGSVLLAAFLVAYYGKEHQYYFTPAEVSAARYVYTHGSSGALLIEGTHNYPAQFKNYERLDYVTIAQEPPASQRRVLAHPVTVLANWMSDPARSGAFVIITRSQKIEVSELGVLPPGSLDRIERALRASPRFAAVFHNRDATVFALARTPRRPT
ncbi:MAG TPA: hypothetical protein VF526_03520 [Solirubrobacteraceae bacterium]|jgi:hypothetical protein